MKENRRPHRDIYGKCLNELQYILARKRINRVMSVGMLMGRPEEEMPGSAGDMLQELSQLHERARQVMQGIAQVRESWTRGCPDSRTIIIGRTPRLRRYKIEDFVPCPDGTFLGVEGNLGDTDM